MSTNRLGELETAVLLAVVRLGREAYGAAIRRDLAERTGREHSVGAVYATLERLQAKALLESWMTEPEAVRGGRARRCYRSTTAGDAALRHAQEAAKALWSGVSAGWSPA